MQTALVTGASRGVGRGVAISLAEAGYRVFATGRSIEGADLPPALSGFAVITFATTKPPRPLLVPARPGRSICW